MFNAATGQIRLNWKVLAGLTAVALIVMLISYLGPEESTAVAATPAPAPANGIVRPPSPDARDMEQLRAAARASVGQGPTSRPGRPMVEEPVRSAHPMVTAAPTTRPMVTAAPMTRPAPVVVAAPTNNPPLPPVVVRAVPATQPMVAAPPPAREPRVTATPVPAAPMPAVVRPAPNQDPGDVDRPRPVPPPAPVATGPGEPSPAPAPETAEPSESFHEAVPEVEPEAGMLAADVASQPVEDGDGSDRPDYLAQTYNFSMRGAEWKDVLDYLSRHTKLSIIGDTQDLNGTVDFYHQEPMSFRQAFRFFNRLLSNTQRIALLRKDHIQIIKVTGSTAWQRYLDLDRLFDGYDAFKAAELPEDEKCVVFYTPQQADGPSLVEMYRPFAPDYMIIQPVGDSNELMVAGQAFDVDRWLQIVQRPIVEDLRQTRRFILKNTQANDVRNLLTTMFNTTGTTVPRPNQPGQPQTSAPKIASDKIDIWADDRNSAVVVKATPRKLDEIAKLIETVDIETADDASMQVYKLQHARAEEVANTLRQVFAAANTPKPGGKTGTGWWRRSSSAPSIPVQVFPDTSTNSLLVLGDKDAQQEVKGLIERFDVEDATGQMVRIPLKNARAEQITQILQQVFGPMMRPTPKGPTMTLAPDMTNNAVVVVGDPQVLAKVQEAVKQLDTSNDQAFEHVVRLEHAKPSEVANALTSVFQPKPGQPAATTRFMPIEAAGTLVIVAPPTDWERIEPMIRLIDEQAQINSPQVKTFALEHADPTMLANILNAAAQGQAQRSPGAALTRVVGDPRTGTLFVQALPENLKEIEALVKELDVPNAQDATVVVPMEKANAALAAQTLQPMANKPSVPGGQPIQIAAEPLTNSIIIRNAGKADLAQIKDILAKMDSTASSIASQTFRPKYIDVGDLANILNAQYVNQQGQPQGTSGVKVIASAGAVSVDAPADVMDKIARKVAEIDVPSPLSNAPMVIEIKSADPKELANNLNAMYGRGPKGPLAQFVANGQTLVVQAPEALREDISKVVKTLDVPGNNVEPKTYKLANADAVQVEAIAKVMLSASNRPGSPPAQVSSDARTNSLIVAALPNQQAQVEQLIAQLDGKPADDTENTSQVVSLVNAQAADIVKILQETLVGAAGKQGGGLSRVRISAGQSSNALVVTGPKGDVAKALAMVQEIEKNAVGSTTRTYGLVSATAADVAKVLEKIASATAGKDAPKVSADERTNTVFITGLAARLDDLEKVIKKMDDPEAEDLRDIDIMTITVTKGDAFDIAYKAQKVLDAKYGKAAPTVDSDFSEPVITVMGPKDTFKKAQEVIDDLIQTAPAAKRRIAVRTTKVPPEMLIKALNEYAREYVTSGSVKVEQAGGHQNVKPEDLLKELGPRMHGSDVTPRPIRMAPGTPSSAAPATRPATGDASKRGPGAPLGMAPVIGILQAMALGQTTAAPATAPAVNVAAPSAQPEESNVIIKVDPETQQLFLMGTDTQIDQIDDLLKMIEDAYKDGDDEAFLIKVYQLQYLNATSAAQALEQMFNDAPVAVPQPPQPQPGQPPQPPQPNQPNQPNQPGQQPGQQGNQQRGDSRQQRGQQANQQGRQPQQMVGGKQRVRAIADLRVNAIIVRCLPQDVLKIATFLSTIDRQPENVYKWRILKIKALKASEVERVIKDVMRMGGGKSGSGAAPAPTPAVPGQQAVAELRQQLIALDLGGETGGGARASISSADTVTVTSEDVSNTLYVAGPEEFLNVVEKFVEQMEQSAEENAQSPRIFNLVRHPSGNVAKVLQACFPQAAGQGGKGATGPMIVSDDMSNTLVVSASSGDMAKIEKLIEQLEGNSNGTRGSVIVRLNRTDAKDVVQMLEQLQGMPGGTGGGSGSRAAYRPSQPTSYTPPSQPQGQGNRGQFRGGQGQRRGGAGGSAAGSQGQPSSDAGDADEAGDATGDAGWRLRTEPSKYGTAGNEPVASSGCHGRVVCGHGTPRLPATVPPATDLPRLNDSMATNGVAMAPGSAAPSFWAIPAVVGSLMLGQMAPVEPAPADEAPATEPAAEDQAAEPQAPPGEPPPEATPPGAEPGPEAPAAGQPAPAEPPVGEAIPQGPADQAPPPAAPRILPRVIRPAQTQPAAPPPAPAQPLPPATQPLPLPALTPEQLEQIRTGQIRVTPIGPNEVLIEGPEESLEAMESLIRRMEEGAPPPTLKIFSLKNAQAAPLAQQLTTIFQQILATGRAPRPEERISVVADPRSNSLIVAASAERMPEIQDLIERLDAKPVLIDFEYRTYLLKHIQASEAAQTLTDLLKKLQQQRGVQGDQFTITPEDRTNTLLVTAPESDLQQIENLIGTLDVPPAFATAEMMVYPLHNVTAKDLVTVLNDMISTQITRAGAAGAGARPGGAAGGAETIRRLKLRTAEGKELPELDLERPIKIIAEPNTNSVVVSSTPENLQSMNDIIKLLDTYPVGESVRVWSFALQYADATELATSLTKTFQDGRSVGLRAAPQGGQVSVVQGVPPTPAGQALMFTAVIMADARTNTLMVAGRQEALQLAEDIITKLDRPGQLSRLPVHVVKLENNEAPVVAPLLEKLFAQQAGSKALADKVSIVAEPATNALVIVANNENFKTLQGLIQELDTFPEVQDLVRTFTLQNADATQVADTLKNLFNQPIYRTGPWTAPEKAPKVTIQADPRTNTIVISAKKEQWPLIEQLVKQMDSPAGPPLTGDFTIIQMRNTDAGRMAGTITDLLDQINKARTAAGGKVTQPAPVIIADPRTNSLLVAGSPPAIEQVQTLVARLDQPSDMPTAEIRPYLLKYASPDKIEAVINELFGRRAGAAAPAAAPGAAARGATQMQVYADMGSGSLIVSASPEDHALVANLVRMLDVADQTSAQVKFFPLQKAQAQTVVQVLQSLYTMRTTAGAGAAAQGQAFGPGAGGARTGGATGVTFTADDRSNSVVVRAAPADMRNIEDLIHRLDTAEVQTEVGIRWVQLKRADASDMAKMLTEFLQVQGTSGTAGTFGGGGGGFAGGGAGNQQRALLINFRQQNPQGDEVLRRLLRQDIRISPDVRTNSLFVMAPPDSVDVLIALIQSLDNISPVTVEIEMFQLQNADATETVDTLERLFGVGQGAAGTTGGAGRAGQTAQEQRQLMLAQQGLGGLPGGVAPGAALTPGAMPGLGAAGLGGAGLLGGLAGLEALGGAGPATAGGRPILSFAVDTRTNSVIAAGAPDYLALVRQLIEQLDSQEMTQRRPIVYAVKYAPSTQLATDLGNFFKEESTRLDQLKEDIPAQRRLEQEVSVVNAEGTNKLLISVSPRYESQVMELVRQLDQQPPMVMIQVLMAEVTLDNRIEWGFEFAAQDLHFTRTGSGHNVVGGTSLGTAGGGGGFTFSLTGEDFSLLLRTLQTESRVNVLSRPQIMVLDNQEANIQVGEQVPYVANYTVTTNGQLQTVVQNQDVGILLKVTPHITPDDFVRMEVAPEISSLSESTVQISENLRAPIITKRTAATTVTVKNGETVVIGGLIRASQGLTDTKVPVLGDIPILGYLFKQQNLTESRDELLIVMTPRIVRTVEDASKLSIEQRDVGQLIPYQTKRSPLWQGLQVITPPVPAVPGQVQEQPAPATQPTMYGPAPILYGPRPPSARTGQETDTPQRQGLSAPSAPGAKDALGSAEPVSYLQQRR